MLCLVEVAAFCLAEVVVLCLVEVPALCLVDVVPVLLSCDAETFLFVTEDDGLETDV